MASSPGASESPTVEDVRSFWENNPLFTGESTHPPGSRAFFEQHREVIIQDGFAGEMDSEILPPATNLRHVLDLGCGPGFWSVELLHHGAQQLTAADLTEAAVKLTQERLETYGLSARVCVENAEQLSFADASFSHVNCQGVIHHTPDTAACVKQIARVLEPGGTASISVYYRNFILRNWRFFRLPQRALAFFGGHLSGRGREQLFTAADTEELVRQYDGSENPIGKAYSKAQFAELLQPHFSIESLRIHFFPSRTSRIPYPATFKRLLDRHCGFLIYAQCRKL